MDRCKVAGVLVALAVSTVCLPGCVPFTIPLDITVVKDLSLDLEGFVAGMPIPPEYASKEYQFCTEWPDVNALKGELRKAVGGLADLVQIRAVSPELVEIQASDGSFASLDSLGLSVLFPDDSVLDVIAEISGDGTRVTIYPNEPVDLLDLLDVYGGNHSCVELTVQALGVVPDPLPTVSIRIKGSLTVEL